MSYHHRTTPISSLPELDDIESRHNGHPQENHPNQPNVAKYIRNNHQLSSHSGMNSVSHQPQHPNQHPNQHQHPNHQQYQNHNPKQNNEQVMFMEEYEVPKKDDNESRDNKYKMPNHSPSCLEVAEHIANCPICSKFYNSDKTPYIIAIVILLIVCILLIKKVLDC